jgi:hypothetical protein
MENNKHWLPFHEESNISTIYSGFQSLMEAINIGLKQHISGFHSKLETKSNGFHSITETTNISFHQMMKTTKLVAHLHIWNQQVDIPFLSSHNLTIIIPFTS